MFYMVKAEAVEFCNVIIVKRVVNLPSILAAADEAHLTQSPQLVRNCRFRHGKSSGDISNVHFPFEQYGNDPQTGWVAEGAE